MLFFFFNTEHLAALQTLGKRCSPPRKSPASTHLSPVWSWGCPQCNQCPAGWHLSRLKMWSVRGRGWVKWILNLLFSFESLIWKSMGNPTVKTWIRHTFLYVVSPDASTPLWPIFFPWPGWPDEEGIWWEKQKSEILQRTRIKGLTC